MRGIIDRLEGDIAVVEIAGKIMKNIHVSVLPYGVKEGAVIDFYSGKWWLNKEETQKRRADMSKKMDKMFE